jgi:hypothetical protein
VHEHSPRPVQLETASARARGRDLFPSALVLASLGSSVALIIAALGMLTLMAVRRRLAWERCEISLLRRDGDGEFYARALGPRQRRNVAVTSPLFRSPTDDLPNEGAALAAHKVIVQRLAWDGWTLDGDGNGVWWQSQFRRPTKVPTEVADA